ncbi:MAG: flagellar basal-body rod protein FlgG [Firmicutes bacterium]|nr:flagellar basal-body rod protein FlgG [Bacillota bacterium]
MIRALWSAATGMLAQQMNVDNTSNNLANVNTNGFKKTRLEFEDLVYEAVKTAAPGQPVEVGYGVKPAATTRTFSQGNVEETGQPLDVAILGDGFFQILLPDNTRAYTRDGSFKLDATGRLVTAAGLPVLVEGATSLPTGASEVQIAGNGEITYRNGESGQRVSGGRIRLVNFPNPAGLEAIGQNLFRATVASGQEGAGDTGRGGLGTLQQHYLERSNVQVVEEMVNLIVAQRAYELNAKAVQAADEMLGQANNLRR